MINNADMSGAFQRPTLVDYLMVAEHQDLDLGLHIYVGKLEVGLIGISGTKVCYADMPGASGDAAVSLLVRLANARIQPERWSTRAVNVNSPWRQLVGDAQASASPGRPQRLAQIRAELQELESEAAAESGVFEISEQPLDADEDRASRVVADLLDWACLEHYLDGELEQARSLATHREQLRPGELLSAANLERLRLRLLEDEIAAGVAEVKE